jgi:hypothetical protein
MLIFVRAERTVTQPAHRQVILSETPVDGHNVVTSAACWLAAVRRTVAAASQV